MSTQGSKTPQRAISLGADLDDDDAVFGLNRNEREWVAHQPYLKAKGYTLRPRYTPNWIPSWKSNGKDPADCEDGWELAAIKTLDAIRDADEKHVLLKKIIPSVDDHEGHDELAVLRYLSQAGIGEHPRNHALPLLDSFPIPGQPNGQFIVTPFLSKWNSVPFAQFNEIVDFIQQLLEGIQFLHEHNIAHRDAQAPNIMMDATPLYAEAFHPCDPRSSLDGLRRLKVKTRFDAPVRYYFIDFGLSSRFPSFEERRLVTGVKGREQRAPELMHRVPPPYDPFKLDIFTLGMLIDEKFLKTYQGFRGLNPLVERMMAINPQERPSADEALGIYTQWAGGLSGITKYWGVLPVGCGIAYRFRICVTSIFGYYWARLDRLFVKLGSFIQPRRTESPTAT